MIQVSACPQISIKPLTVTQMELLVGKLKGKHQTLTPLLLIRISVQGEELEDASGDVDKINA
jgi:hypothetical protein